MQNSEEKRSSTGQADTQPFVIPLPLPSLYRHMFNFSGRTGVLQFVVDFIVFMLSFVIAAGILAWLDVSDAKAQAVIDVMVFVNLVAINAAAARRFRDAGYPAYSGIMVLIPIAGIFWAGYRLLQPSDTDTYQKAQLWYKEHAKRNL